MSLTPMLYSKRKLHWANCTSSMYCAIVKSHIFRPTLSPARRLLSPERCFPLYSLYHPQAHTLNQHHSEKAVAASPLKEFVGKRLPRKFHDLLAFSRKTERAYLSIGETSENLHFARNCTKRSSMTPSGQRLAIFTTSSANPPAAFRY